MAATIVLVYSVGMIGWALCRWRWPDRWWWLFLLNSFAPYLFAPLPLMLVLAGLSGQALTWLACAAMAALAIILFRLHQWLLPRPNCAGSPTLRVLTWNVLHKNTHHLDTVAALRRSNADIIALQELTCDAAQVLSAALIDLYPHQCLAAQLDDSGMGVLSRYPLRPLPHDMHGVWIGPPQVLQCDRGGQRITLINAHPISTPPTNPLHMHVTMQQRSNEAKTLAAFAAIQPNPVLIMGDFNAAPHSLVHDVMCATLRDAWDVAGRGLGHTFPGSNPIDLQDYTQICVPNTADKWLPKWLTRIDFIFHSPHFCCTRARLGPWDGYSDHRPVYAELVLK